MIIKKLQSFNPAILILTFPCFSSSYKFRCICFSEGNTSTMAYVPVFKFLTRATGYFLLWVRLSLTRVKNVMHTSI